VSSNSNISTIHRLMGSNALVYGLVGAFIAVLSTGGWLLWRTDMEWMGMEDRVNAWSRTAETSGELGPILAAIYTAGVEPPEPGGKADPEPVPEIRKAYEAKCAMVAERVRNFSIPADRDALLKELDEMQDGAREMLGMVDTLRGVGRPRGGSAGRRASARGAPTHEAAVRGSGEGLAKVANARTQYRE
jgi:hypothetical protein